MKLPIWNNRELVGYASSIAAAKKLLKSRLSIPKRFSLFVCERPDYMQEILELPAGYVYSISYSY